MKHESYSQLVVVADSDGVTSSFELQPQGSGTLVNVKLDAAAEADAVAHSLVVLAYAIATDGHVRRKLEQVLLMIDAVLELRGHDIENDPPF